MHRTIHSTIAHADTEVLITAIRASFLYSYLLVNEQFVHLVVLAMPPKLMLSAA